VNTKKNIIYILIILSIFNCTTIKKNRESKINQKEYNEENKQSDNNEYNSNINIPKDKIEDINFVAFSFSNVIDKAIPTSKNIYKTCYEFYFRFIYKDNFMVSYKIFDEDNNLLFYIDNDNAKLLDYENNIYEIKNSFYDHTLHSFFRFKLDVKNDDNDDNELNFVGDFNIKDIPLLKNINVGPFISKYDPKSNQSLLKINLTVTNSTLPVWARLIPPTSDFFWNLDMKQIYNNVFISGVIADNKHQNYLLNGEYILQLNFGKLGMIEKIINIVDVFNNKNGPNYGIPIAMEENNDKNFIKINITRMDLIDHLELIIYEKEDIDYKKLGTISIRDNFSKIEKKDIFNNFENDEGNKVVLKYNKKYYYQISLHSRPFDIEYVSLSPYFPITFIGFGFFNN